MRSFVLLFLAVVVALGTLAVRVGADTEIEVAKVTAGPQMSWMQCPCFRWVVQVQAAGGRIETRDFLISSDSLFKLHQEESFDFQQFAVRILNVGAIEALWTGGHIGLGFNGVTFGEDRDRGYTQLLQSGLYALVSMIQSGSVRLDLHSGYDFETMRVNNGPQISRNQLNQALAFKWNAGAWSGNVTGRIGLDAAHMLDPAYFDAAASASVRARIFRLSDVEMGLSLNLGYEHDGWRNFMGLDPDLVTGSLLMDLSYVAGPS
jgi:hypothetical protein